MKIKTIKGYNCFSILFQGGSKIKQYPGFASVCYDTDDTSLNAHWKSIFANSDNTLYMGVTISKRIAKKAVVRNRIKRLLRESIRKVVKELLASGDSINFKTIIISWRKAPARPKEISLDDVYPAVKKIIQLAIEKNN